MQHVERLSGVQPWLELGILPSSTILPKSFYIVHNQPWSLIHAIAPHMSLQNIKHLNRKHECLVSKTDYNITS